MSPSGAEHRMGRAVGGGGPSAREPVLFLGGPIQSADQQYAGLLAILGDRVSVLCKDYELFRGDGPPEGYGIPTEVEGIARAADARRWGAFHIVGYSAGGSLGLAFAAAYPDRTKSLALIEPGEIGRGRLTLQDPAFGNWEETMMLPALEGMRRFLSQVLGPGVEMPPMPPGMPPPWDRRPRASLMAFGKASLDYELDESRLETLKAPVLVALGALSHPRFARVAEVLCDILPDVTVETYEGSHHLNPPHQAHPERFATALQGIWRRRQGSLGAAESPLVMRSI